MGLIVQSLEVTFSKRMKDALENEALLNESEGDRTKRWLCGGLQTWQHAIVKS